MNTNKPTLLQEIDLAEWGLALLVGIVLLCTKL